MIQLLTLDDRIDLVVTEDPAVKTKKGQEPAALPLKDVKTTGDPLVFTVRTLSSSEALRMMTAGPSESDAIIMATENAVCGIKGGDVDAKDPEAVADTLERLPAAVRSLLGAYIITSALGQNTDPSKA